MVNSIEEVYFTIDEIVKSGIEKKEKRGRKSKLGITELITILVEGHKRGLTTEKQIFQLVKGELRTCFGEIPCYSQFNRSIKRVRPYLDLILAVFAKINGKKNQTLCIVDSTSLPVAGYNKKDVKWALHSAGKGKNMHGFYQGFKLHIIVNQDQEIVSVATTKANVHDIQLLKKPDFIKHVNGILVGDKGYIASSSHQQFLIKNGIQLLAKQRKNMDPFLNSFYQKFFKQRRRIETIFAHLKTRLSLIFPFLRTPEAFLVHVKAALLAYILRKFPTQLIHI